MIVAALRRVSEAMLLPVRLGRLRRLAEALGVPVGDLTRSNGGG
jgi:hypothetical protein